MPSEDTIAVRNVQFTGVGRGNEELLHVDRLKSDFWPP